MEIQVVQEVTGASSSLPPRIDEPARQERYRHRVTWSGLSECQPAPFEVSRHSVAVVGTKQGSLRVKAQKQYVVTFPKICVLYSRVHASTSAKLRSLSDH